jgi:hypothetical protein
LNSVIVKAGVERQNHNAKHYPYVHELSMESST